VASAVVTREEEVNPMLTRIKATALAVAPLIILALAAAPRLTR
jgi:hypothetical protein